MFTRHRLKAAAVISAAAVAPLARAADPAVTGTPVPQYSFVQLAALDGYHGQNPLSGVVLDKAGDLFGTAQQGGTGGYGTVYEVAAGSHALSAVVNFNYSNGAYPDGGVTSDSAGDLTGETTQGGANGVGNVFQVSAGSVGSFQSLADFSSGANPNSPTATLTPQSNGSGNLWGVGNNQLFKFSATASSTVFSQASFSGSPSPYGSVVFDKYGDLFGTTQLGGTNGGGYLYRFNTNSGQLMTLYNFPASAAHDQAAVTLDSAGNLYVPAGASILELSSAQSRATSTLSSVSTLYTFTGGADGAGPNGSLILDSAGDIFGTTSGGGILPNGQAGAGTVFELTAGTSRTLDTLYTFDGSLNGSTPTAGLAIDAAGDLFGTTSGGGSNFDGTVFELSPAPVPEPATLSAAVLATTALAVRRRRRD
jgi:uncharacterized repeat protein (TIGR03803 family)